MIWAIYGAVSLLSFFLWVTIHELAHIAAAKFTCGVSKWRIYPYPHTHADGFYWGRATWWPLRQANDEEQIWISLAPRIPDITAALVFPLFLAFHWWIPAIIAGAGLVDFFTGSLGIREHSDLRRAATAWKLSPWVLRIAGMAVITASVIVGLSLALL
jgi:hypothetical protein